MALVGLVRVSTSKQEAARQHDALDGLWRRIILARHTDGESIRTIARATKVSVGTVHKVLADHRGTR